MKFTYTTDMRDFRAASYYGALLRNRMLFWSLLIFLPLVLVYYIGTVLGLWPTYAVVNYILIAYLVWMMLFFGNVERTMLRYTRSKDSMLGVECRVTMDSERIKVDIESRNIYYSTRIAELAGVFELKDIYLVYLDSAQMFIFPKRSIADTAAFEKRIQRSLKDRFEKRKKWRKGRA